MAYKAALGLSEIVVGVLLAVPSFDPQATFARLSAEELREDPGDRVVALIGRHLPSLLHHRGLVAVALVLVGLAKLVAAAPCGKATSGVATCWRRPSRCWCPSTCAKPSPTPPRAMSCWPWRMQSRWWCWCCSCEVGCLVGHSEPEPTADRRCLRGAH
jgi:hypothetical protein